jgi:predicted nucleic acid-binding protein
MDTNVLVRHLTGDPPKLARQATEFLAQADELLLADLGRMPTIRHVIPG